MSQTKPWLGILEFELREIEQNELCDTSDSEAMLIQDYKCAGKVYFSRSSVNSIGGKTILLS